MNRNERFVFAASNPPNRVPQLNSGERRQKRKRSPDQISFAVMLCDDHAAVWLLLLEIACRQRHEIGGVMREDCPAVVGGEGHLLLVSQARSPDLMNGNGVKALFPQRLR